MANTSPSNSEKTNQVIPGFHTATDAAFSNQPNKFTDIGLNNNLLSLIKALGLNNTNPSDAAVSTYLQNYFQTLNKNISNNNTNRFLNRTTQPFLFSIKNLNKTYPGPAKFYDGGVNNIARRVWKFPVPPESFSVSVPSSPNVITTISGNTFTHAGNIELEEITFSGFFPFLDNPTDTTHRPQYIPDYITSTDYHSPGEWVSKLVSAFRANQPLEFCIYAPTPLSNTTVTSDSGLVIYPTSVSIAAFDWTMGSAGGDRRDVEFNITLKRWKEQRMQADSYTVSKRRDEAQPRTYKTKKRGNVQDTLLIISKDFNKGKQKYHNLLYKENKANIKKWYAAYKKRKPNSKKTLFNFPLPLNQTIKLPKAS